MNQLDLLYRALIEYKKYTSSDDTCKQVLDVIRNSNVNDDLITLTKYNCKIDLDWIEEIEQNIEFLEKAIKEERQFITSEGEVIEIEKVKNVSRETFEHLARHSELITRETTGDVLTPDKLYTVKKLTDYSIYENRFLYMVLCYLRDFITVRYDNIKEKMETYHAKTEITKKVSHKNQIMEFSLFLNDTIKEDPIMSNDNPAKSLLERINMLLQTVLILLKTPLMIEVAKAPMLRPPIVKTNVLKMNKNFSKVVALYEFINAYTKPGYEIEEINEKESPLNKECALDFSQIVLLSSFLTYQHANKIKKLLQINYDKEEERLRKEERIKFEEHLLKAKRRVEESNMGYEEYILLLEQKNRMLEKDSVMLEQSKEQIENLNKEIKNLNDDLKMIDLLNKHIEELELNHTTEVNQLIKQYSQEINALIEKQNSEIESIRQGYEEQIENVSAEWQAKYTNLGVEKDNQLKQIQDSNALYCENLKKQVQESTNYANQKDMELQNALKQCSKLDYEKHIILGELNGIRRRYNLHDLNAENYANAERIHELEEELKAFTAFFNEIWRKAKPIIRKRVFKENPYVPKIKK